MSCIQYHRSRVKVLKENGKSATFNNGSLIAFEVGLVDGCLINDSRRRCDYFVRIDLKIWLIELKGRDVRTAIAQIVETTHHLKAEIGTRECIPVIITSQSPAISGKQKELLAMRNAGCAISKNIVLRTRTATISIS